MIIPRSVCEFVGDVVTLVFGLGTRTESKKGTF